MTVKFKAIPVEEPVKRYRLEFSSAEDFQEACKRIADLGFVRFRNGTDHDLIGQPVRVSHEMRVIEVDAARDTSSA